jgi:hypothetical protein
MACDVVSPALAAGKLLIITVPDPFAMMPGPPGAQAIEQGTVWSETRAALKPPILTVGEPELMASGAGGCGSGIGGGPGCIGLWQWGPG